MYILVIIIAVFGMLAAASGFGALGQTAANNGNLHTYKPATGGVYSLSTEYQEAFGWNGTAWVTGTITTVTADAQGVPGISISFPAGQHISTVVLFTGNKTQDVSGLLQHSLFFSVTNITTTNAKLTGAYLLFGTNHNSSAVNKYNDKAITHSWINSTIFNSSVNNINQNVKISVPYMFAQPTALAGYVFTINTTANNATTAASLTIYQQFEAPFSLNLEELVYSIGAVLALIAFIPMYFAVPRRYD